MTKSSSICEKVIAAGFYFLFLLTPLVFTPWTRELFEFPKMLLVYVITIVITAAFAIKSVGVGRATIPKTPLDKPIFAFLSVYLIATIFSIDPYTSIFGYYTRFNGGLLSVICFIVLYYILNSELSYPHRHSEETSATEESLVMLRKLIFCLLFSSFLISVWGILEHFGVDKSYWKQNVQARVFSTLGQPNWLAAYLIATTPVPLSLVFSNPPIKHKLRILLFTIYYLLFIAAYAAIWFTYSLSGLIGLGTALVTFFILTPKTYLKNRWKILAALAATCAIISLSTPGLFLPRIKEILRIGGVIPQAIAQEVVGTSSSSVAPEVLELGGRTGRIRLIVWKGAIDAIFSNPKTTLIGSGPETFAYAFLPHRPKELNQTIEWDFLYNKAHNEYLNLGVCTGLLGLGSYLWFIVRLVLWTIRRLKESPNSLIIGIFSGWASLLVTSFFGFHVVATSMLFWLYPAIIFSLLLCTSDKSYYNHNIGKALKP